MIMAAHQSEGTIGAAVSSVLWQSHDDFELIVVDDGSRDRTSHVVEAFGDDRIRLLRQDNAGAAAARNLALSHAAGPYITFLDSDDILFGHHLEALLHTHGGRSRTIATANSYWLLPHGIDPAHTRHKGPFPRPERQRVALLEQNYLSPMSLFSRDLLDVIGGFDVSLPRSEDWDFWLRAVFDGGCHVVHQPRALSLYRWGSSSMSTARELVFGCEDTILWRMAARDDLTSEEREYLTRRLASPAPRLLSNRGDAALRVGDYKSASEDWSAAARLMPSERMLVRKARLLSMAPRILGPVLRRRQMAREAALGFDPSFEH